MWNHAIGRKECGSYTQIVSSGSMIGTSSLLTDVSFGGDYIREWVIQAPNLTHLTISSEINYGWVLEELTSLRSAVIDLWDFVVDSKFAKFLLGVVQVRKLLVVMCNATSGAMIPEIHLCTFHNLKSLKLYMHFCDQPPIMLAFCLLKSSPNLEKLKIEIYYDEEQIFEADKEFQNALWTDGMCANLQAVQMTGINWRRNEMVFIELILSKAKLLHTLSISHGEKIVMPSEDALNELLRYKRASAEAQVLFKVLRGSVKFWIYCIVKLRSIIRSGVNFWALRETSRQVRSMV
ncbi:hypothetical protein QYE76_005478 [Lolium multiflorum]|uniref:FBD domain-containing protein n=1 Tax=Lolium multiflorum TaxID=4521 RepID=A0AAD8RTZ5_LOLMU|nr:hypothetical protein QYE76_005478 [Lolium multiflorum]